MVTKNITSLKTNHVIKLYTDTIAYKGLWAQVRFILKKIISEVLRGANCLSLYISYEFETKWKAERGIKRQSKYQLDYQ